MKPYPTDIYQVADHLAALIESYAGCANAIRKEIDDTDEAGDNDTADMLHRSLPRARQGAVVPRGPHAGAKRHVPKLTSRIACPALPRDISFRGRTGNTA